jgi:hypothetical protein
MSSEFSEHGVRYPKRGELRFQQFERPMEARFEMGEVLLSARIFEVLSQFLVRIVTRYLALANQVSKLQPGSSSEFGRLSKGQYALGVESDGKLNPKTRLHLRHEQP